MHSSHRASTIAILSAVRHHRQTAAEIAVSPNVVARLIPGARRRDHITPVLLEHTGCLFIELYSRLPVWFFSRCPYRLHNIWSMTAVLLLVREDHSIPNCVVFHGCTTVSVTAAFPHPVHTCGTICLRTFDKSIWVMNVSNSSWKLICLEIMAHCDFFIFAPLIFLLTGLLHGVRPISTQFCRRRHRFLFIGIQNFECPTHFCITKFDQMWECNPRVVNSRGCNQQSMHSIYHHYFIIFMWLLQFPLHSLVLFCFEFIFTCLNIFRWSN